MRICGASTDLWSVRIRIALSAAGVRISITLRRCRDGLKGAAMLLIARNRHRIHIVQAFTLVAHNDRKWIKTHH